MPSKILTLLLSLAAQSGVCAHPTGPRAIAEISTALVLLDAPRRAWAFVKYSPGSDNVCGELCEWDAIASKVSTPPSRVGRCGYDRAHGELPGQSGDLRARPASIAPARAKAKELETQAPYNKSQTGPFTFKCYGADVTTSGDTNVICDGP